MHPNPLLSRLLPIYDRIESLKGQVRDFYFEVLLSRFSCPSCDGRLAMMGTSSARCLECGATLNPTVAFERSPCCRQPLVFRRSHYACTRCHAPVSSKFLFDERVFGAPYFRERMQACRERKRLLREARRAFLGANRSETLLLDSLPGPAVLEEMFVDLDAFVGTSPGEPGGYSAEGFFPMELYRRHIVECLQGSARLFDSLPAIGDDRRMDRVRRFMVLLFMEQAREVRLAQQGEAILVVPYAADDKG